jgi:hypothetical protein
MSCYSAIIQQSSKTGVDAHIAINIYLLQHVVCNFLNSAEFLVPPCPPKKWNWCLLNELQSADENSSMECIMLLYAACCTSLFGNNLLRSCKISSCYAISSGLLNNNVALSSSGGISVGMESRGIGIKYEY